MDDCLAIRQLLCKVFSQDPDFEIVGTASNGRLALSKIKHLKPDIITLDIEMPEMNGFVALVEIRKLYPTLPVVMFSTLTDKGAQASLDALSLGASDCAKKPSSIDSLQNAKQYLERELVSKIKAIVRKKISPCVKTLPRNPAYRICLERKT